MNSQTRGHLFTGGDIYNTVDPFATALLLEDGVVAWLGSDEAAEGTGVARDRGDVERIDLEGDLVAPAFVNALAEVSGPAEESALLTASAAAGVLGVHVVSQAREAADDGPVHVTRYLRLTDADAPDEAIDWVASAERFDGLALDLERVDPAPALAAAGSAHVPLRLGLRSPSGLARLEAALEAHGARAAHRIDLSFVPDADQTARLAKTYLPVTLDPALVADPIAGLLAAGVSLSFGFGSAAAAPWDVLRSAVFSGAQAAISARAAYTAATRGGWRAVGLPEEGLIRMGSATPLTRWQVGSLVVQAADDRVAAWSTDPRSGTPGLPDLAGAPPVLVGVL